MITKRIIPCLDVKDGRVVKGVRFKGLNDVSSPVELAGYYTQSGADELVFYDITASAEGRGLFTDILRETASRVFIPLTVGGGINTLEDFDRVPNYDKGLEIGAAPGRGITEEEAYELVRDYWNFIPGTIAEETGFEMFLTSFGSMKGSNGRTYYEIRLQWLVDGDTEWGHLSTIDVMYVDAETGELVGDMLP